MHEDTIFVGHAAAQSERSCLPSLSSADYTHADPCGMIVQPIIPRPKDSAGLANIDLSTKLRAFYQSPAHADIQLRAGSEVFPAHKIVLAAQSPTFERMFESGMVEQCDVPCLSF